MDLQKKEERRREQSVFKACSRCGKIHDAGFHCIKGKTYQSTKERELRSRYVWTKKSQEIREKANHLCEVCRDQNVYTYDNLEVHHIDKLRDREDLYLDDHNLICLCVEHHKQADDNELDKDYLFSLASAREGR